MARKQAADEKKAGLVVDRDLLVAALSKARAASDPKSNQAPLKTVLLRQKDAALTVTGTNLYVTQQVQISVEPNGDDVACCADAKQIVECAKAMPEGFLRLRTEGENLHVEAVDSKRAFKLRTLKVDEFPKVASLNEGAGGFQVGTADFLAALAKVEKAIGDDVTNPTKNSMLLDEDDGGGVLAAIDGHRLHVVAFAVTSGAIERMVIPKVGVSLIKGACEGHEKISVRRQGSDVFFSVSGSRLSMKLYEDDKSVDWRNFLGRKVAKGGATVKSSSLIDALRAANVMAGGVAPTVSVELQKDVIRVEGEEEKGSAVDEVECSYAGPKMKFHSNARYLVEALQAAGDEATISVTAPLDPVFIYGDGFDSIVMPVRPASA